MSKFKDDRPDFERRSNIELVALLDGIREILRYADDASDVLLELGRMLHVNLEAGYYDEEEMP